MANAEAFCGHCEVPIVDHTCACRNEVSERAWAHWVTWRRPVSFDEGQTLAANLRALGTGEDISGAGQARTRPQPEP